MIRHIVIIQFKKDLHPNYSELMEKTRPFLAQIPGIVDYKIYPNCSKYVPKDIFSLGVQIYFENQKAMDIFMEHPKHYEANALFEKYLADPPYMVLTHDEV